MTKTHPHDPVNAISEAEATGRTAEIFAEIQEVMQIPLVTSIWRTLDAVEGGLESTWAATRPIYKSGHAEALLQKLQSSWELPIPNPLSAQQIKHPRGKPLACRPTVASRQRGIQEKKSICAGALCKHS